MKMFKEVESSLTIVLLKMPEATTVKPYQYESLKHEPEWAKIYGKKKSYEKLRNAENGRNILLK